MQNKKLSKKGKIAAVGELRARKPPGARARTSMSIRHPLNHTTLPFLPSYSFSTGLASSFALPPLPQPRSPTLRSSTKRRRSSFPRSRLDGAPGRFLDPPALNSSSPLRDGCRGDGARSGEAWVQGLREELLERPVARGAHAVAPLARRGGGGG